MVISFKKGNTLTEEEWYRVRRDWKDAGSQVGAFHVLEYAKACADKNLGSFVFDEDGKVLYPERCRSCPYVK